MTVPTRWRTALEDQISDARRRVEAAERQLQDGDGGRALQAAYPAVVAAATVRVWLAEPPWHRGMAPNDMQRKVRDAFPGRFGALAVLDLRDVLTSPWTTDAAEPYVLEARAFVQETTAQLESWLGQG
ncbi:MAG: hypothetical protein HYW06_07385 [Gemmatimonadetes bacterium]|nr:hypothetical protein [Gemmatimonadota bacterium]MBI2401993.1 hypothetical protein [Gemmatimonadota bacterium]MBI2536771.1 hypothetical protein [Gemmatimonadota bacterium]